MRAHTVLLCLWGCGHPRDRTATEPGAPTGETGGDTGGSVASKPFAFQGELIEIADPMDPWLAATIAGTAYASPGAFFKLYVVAADTAATLESAGVEGRRINAYTADGYDWELAAGESPGSYTFTDYDRPLYHYLEGTHVDVELGEVDASDGSAELFQPSYPIVTVPESIDAGAPLVIAFALQGFVSEVAVVIDSGGAVDWTDDPSDIASLYAVNSETVTSVTIPASAFPSPGDYAVGLAACVRTFSSDLDRLEPDLTALRSGRMAYWRVAVH